MNISRATADDLIELLEILKDNLVLDARYEVSPNGERFPNYEMEILDRVKLAINFLRFPDDPS